MNHRQRFLLLTCVSVLFLSGCCTHTDLTHTPQVQASGIIGRRYHTTTQLELLKDKPSRTLRLVTRDYPPYPRNTRLGVVPRGTPLELDRVVRIKELAAMMYIFPVYYEWECTFARIESGPYAGKEIAVQGKGLLPTEEVAQQIATIGKAHLEEVQDKDLLQPSPR